jgi:hypothetical protein
MGMASTGHLNLWNVQVNNQVITSDLQQTVYKHCASQLGKKYWEKKLDHNLGVIDWSATALAMSEITKTRQQWISKHSSGFCGVGKMMHRMKQWSTPACPRCGQAEDAEHVWVCQQTEVQQMWEAAMEEVASWLRIQGTQPEISTAIINGLNAWRNKSNVQYDDYDKEVSTAATLQHQSGWKNFFEGRPNIHWSTLQAKHFVVALKSRQSGKRWIVELIKKLLGVAWDLWEH